MVQKRQKGNSEIKENGQIPFYMGCEIECGGKKKVISGLKLGSVVACDVYWTETQLYFECVKFKILFKILAQF